MAEATRKYYKENNINSEIIIVCSPLVQKNFRLQLFDENKLEEDALDSHLLSIVIDYEVPNLNLQASIVLQSEDVN